MESIKNLEAHALMIHHDGNICFTKSSFQPRYILEQYYSDTNMKKIGWKLLTFARHLKMTTCREHKYLRHGRRHCTRILCDTVSDQCFAMSKPRSALSKICSKTAAFKQKGRHQGLLVCGEPGR